MTLSSLEAKDAATSHPSSHLSKGKETSVKRRQSDLAKRRSFTDYLPYPIVDHLLTPVQQSAAKAARQIIFLLLSKLKQGHLTVTSVKIYYARKLSNVVLDLLKRGRKKQFFDRGLSFDHALLELIADGSLKSRPVVF